MWVVISMASGTSCIRIFERLRLVAVVTLIIGVLTQQWEGGQVVVEEDRVLPIHFGVTGSALTTQRTLMCVIFQVAGVAACC